MTADGDGTARQLTADGVPEYDDHHTNASFTTSTSAPARTEVGTSAA
jgi:hypothetical protein